jgi:hypothetical protein
MSEHAISRRSFCIFSGLSSVAGVLMLVLSFAINPGPPHNADCAELGRFGQSHSVTILWGAWLQAVGPVLIVLFAFALVHLAGAAQRLAGWMTLFGASVLVTTSLIEITLYISALFPDPALMPTISLRIISAVQHLYFIVAAPALFLPLSIILLGSSILPKIFGYLGLVLAILFGALGVVFLHSLTLPDSVTAVAGMQAVWWFGAGLTLMFRNSRNSIAAGTSQTAISHPI